MTYLGERVSLPPAVKVASDMFFRSCVRTMTSKMTTRATRAVMEINNSRVFALATLSSIWRVGLSERKHLRKAN